jgi:hypothetical protein
MLKLKHSKSLLLLFFRKEVLAISLLSLAAAAPIDYSQPANWACRPGQETLCTTGLDALVVAADGTRTPQPFTPATAAPIDCFYVYPTVSEEKQDYADMTLSPEVARVVHAQAGRLTSRCRVFAPVYRQLTLLGLRKKLIAGEAPDFGPAYTDVLAAWHWYLAHDNAGRGVVLVGHSQGTILLQQLIADEIDGKPSQKVLVAAFLGGDPALTVPKGTRVGGIFKHVPLCTAAAETGCAYVWSSYRADDTSVARKFGANASDTSVAGCVNPAAPAGGPAALKTYFNRPKSAPDSDPPYIELIGQLSAQCVADDQGNVLRVTIDPTPFAARLDGALQIHLPGWGLHVLDIALTQGNILDDLSAETATWTRTH